MALPTANKALAVSYSPFAHICSIYASQVLGVWTAVSLYAEGGSLGNREAR